MKPRLVDLRKVGVQCYKDEINDSEVDLIMVKDFIINSCRRFKDKLLKLGGTHVY